MPMLYLISFVPTFFGFFGVGHLFAGSPSRALSYFVAGVIWVILAGVLGISTGGSALCCFLPLHIMFAHFCSADAVRIARGGA